MYLLHFYHASLPNGDPKQLKPFTSHFIFTTVLWSRLDCESIWLTQGSPASFSGTNRNSNPGLPEMSPTVLATTLHWVSVLCILKQIGLDCSVAASHRWLVIHWSGVLVQWKSICFAWRNSLFHSLFIYISVYYKTSAWDPGGLPPVRIDSHHCDTVS